ncbi:MAG: T9SS type A sorting domain-containing protein [Bacteroidetes bacterium]|nr:T9SS type A sorting domain-containing protein [Bacteroidota bacterium]
MPWRRSFHSILLLMLFLALSASRGLLAQGVPAPFDAHLYLTYYHGGSAGESTPIPLVDRAGNVVLCGTTSSIDFPQLPAGPVFMKNDYSVFIAKHDREGATLLYSRRFGSNLRLVDAAIGANDAVVLLVDCYNGLSLDTLLTADAADSTRSHYGFLVLDCQGNVAYASYVPMSGLNGITDFEVSPEGEIWLLSSTTGTPPMTTPDALFPVKQGKRDGYLMRFSASDYRLEYATFLGGPDDDDFQDLAVNSSGVALIGYSSGSGGFPAVHALQDTIAGARDFILMRLDPDAKHILFSSYLGGARYESIDKSTSAGNLLQLDSAGTMYFIGTTSSSPFPHADTLQIMPFMGSYGSTLLGVIEPDGTLRRVSLLGYPNGIRISDIEVDGCGLVLCTGWVSGQELILTNPLMTSGGTFVSAFDTRAGAVRMTTRIRGPQSDQGQLCLDGNALFLSGVADTSGLPPTPGLPGPWNVRYNSDAFIAAFAMGSLCGRPALGDSSMRKIALELTAPDTLLIDVPRKLVKPARFPISLRVRNQSATDTTGTVQMHLHVEGGIELDGFGAGTDTQYAALSPLGDVGGDWTVLTDFDRIYPRGDVYLVVSARTEDPCPMGASVVKSIKVIYTDLTYADVRCSVDQMNLFESDANRTTLATDSVTLRVRIINHSDNDAPLQGLALRFPPNSGLSPIAPDTMWRGIAPITPRDTVELGWTIHAQTWQYDREVYAQVVIVDTFGYEQRSCVAELFVPGVSGSFHHLQAPATLLLRGDGMTQFDTIAVHLRVENETDTVRFYSDLVLDLSSAPHLRAADGETLHRGAFYVRERFRRITDWRLAAMPGIDSEVTDTLRIRYITDSDGATHTGTAVIRLMPRRAQLACMWIASDTLVPGKTPALDDTVKISAVFTNTGDLRQELATAWLRPPDSVGVSESLRRPLASLEPGQSDTVTWHLEVPRQAKAHDLLFEAIALRADDSEATRCAHTLHVLAAGGRYTYACATAGHDSVWYDPYYGRFIPNPLQLQYTLANTGEVVMPSCDIAIILPPMLRCAAGEDSVRIVPVLQPGEQWSAEWLLEINDAQAYAGEWVVRWEVRSGDSLLDVSCAHGIGAADEAPAGIVLTPWLLRFEGERGEAPPPSRELQVWTGGGVDPLWSIAAAPPWFDVQPAWGRGHVRTQAGPNSSMLVPGQHVDSLVLAPAALHPGTVRISYHISGVLGVENVPSPDVPYIRSIHPNPIGAGGMLIAEIVAPPAQSLLVTVHDLLGRERWRISLPADAAARRIVPLSTTGFASGIYLLSVQGAGVRRTRSFIISH